MKEKIELFWKQASERDRLMLIIGGIVCSFYLFYALVYQPLALHVEARQRQLLEKRATLAWMKQVQPQAHAERQVAKKVSSEQLLTTISNQLKIVPFKDNVHHIEQSGTHEIQLSYEAVPYSQFLTWFSELSKIYKFSIQRFNLEKTDKSGVVKVLVILDVS
jgi:general secretion pathway protein M